MRSCARATGIGRQPSLARKGGGLWPLCLGGYGFGGGKRLFADAAAGFDFGQRQLPDVEPLDGGQVAKRPQEVLPAAPLHDATELMLETLDAFYEGDAEGIADTRALRTELVLDELLGITGEALVAHDHALGGLDARDLGVETIRIRQIELPILEHDQHEITAQVKNDIRPYRTGFDDDLLTADAQLGQEGRCQRRPPAAFVVDGGSAAGWHDDLVHPLLVH